MTESVEITNKMQPCNRIYYSNNKFYYKVASCCVLLLIHTTMHGSMNIKFINAKQAIEIHALINAGIINSITKLHLVGYFYWFILRCTDPWILKMTVCCAGWIGTGSNPTSTTYSHLKEFPIQPKHIQINHTQTQSARARGATFFVCWGVRMI